MPQVDGIDMPVFSKKSKFEYGMVYAEALGTPSGKTVSHYLWQTMYIKTIYFHQFGDRFLETLVPRDDRTLLHVETVGSRTVNALWVSGPIEVYKMGSKRFFKALKEGRNVLSNSRLYIQKTWVRASTPMASQQWTFEIDIPILLSPRSEFRTKLSLWEFKIKLIEREDHDRFAVID